MALKTNITGGAGGLVEADVVDGANGNRYRPRGLTTYQIPYLTEVNRQTYAVNTTYGNEMAINAAISGATDAIHDGTDSVLWTGTNLSGTTFIFDSTTVAASGTKSIDATGTVDNNVALLTRSTPVTMSTYSSLTGSIYLSAWSTSGTKAVNLAFRLAGSVVSATVNIGDYINTAVTNTWLNFVIPLADLGITSATVDELTITTVDPDAGPPPDYYLDDLKLSAGSGEVYTIAPTGDDDLRVYGISWTLVDAGTAALINGTVPGLSYDKFGVATKLTNGILTRRVQFGVTGFTNSTTCNADIISGANAELLAKWDDGVNTYLKFYTKFSAPVDLSPAGGDRYEFVVQDDLSGLISLNIRADAALLTRPDGESI